MSFTPTPTPAAKLLAHIEALAPLRGIATLMDSLEEAITEWLETAPDCQEAGDLDGFLWPLRVARALTHPPMTADEMLADMERVREVVARRADAPELRPA